jgi:hypothetical protein
VVEATGVDAFGNYYYKVCAFNRFGVNYAFALRADYGDRWNKALDGDLVQLITGSHISSAAYHRQTNFK